ncbi:hypothetical protein [Xenorhabdus anantnagensis]|uniref:Uncharacterized protein n=1 Tax=Xenorhabdus anantnagensis TaxID=3025875 RepID=A0ABT5LX96_9GAMM|nr:hypothetical protein [Xenorhabdus anantnagensis]MDC9599042.1 hypothetical protein [Xenorhabdus anantnagensis]
MLDMNLANQSVVVTMSSIDFLNDIINPARVEAGEKPVRPSDFHVRVNDEIGENINYENFVVGKTGHKTYYAILNMDQMMLVGMRESKAVRRIVLAKLKALSSPPQLSAAELIAAIANNNVQQEKRLIVVEQKVEQMEQGTIPVGYQGYSYLQATYGLSNAKSKQLVMAWSVPHKKVPHVAPGGQVTQMSVVYEESFEKALHQMMKEAEQRGSQWYHPKMGRFSITGWKEAA